MPQLSLPKGGKPTAENELGAKKAKPIKNYQQCPSVNAVYKFNFNIYFYDFNIYYYGSKFKHV